jgi:mRNA interferase HicA
MKRRDLVRHLEQYGCELLREGGNHSVYVNRAKQKTSTVPRHREINDYLARKIAVTWRFLRLSYYQGAANVD